MKSVSKNKFLTCFRPVVDFDTNVAYPSTNRCKHDRASSSMFSDGSGSRLIETHVVDHPPKQTLAKVIKAMVFQTILVSLLNQHCLKRMINYLSIYHAC